MPKRINLQKIFRTFVHFEKGHEETKSDLADKAQQISHFIEKTEEDRKYIAALENKIETLSNELIILKAKIGKNN